MINWLLFMLLCLATWPETCLSMYEIFRQGSTSFFVGCMFETFDLLFYSHLDIIIIIGGEPEQAPNTQGAGSGYIYMSVRDYFSE